jgi:hypothetical protein
MAASLALPALFNMLPLRSRMTPMEIGTSSDEKVHNFLFDVVFEDSEVVDFETRDEPVVRVRYGDLDECQLHIHVDGFAVRNNVPRCVVFDIALDVRLGRSGSK